MERLRLNETECDLLDDLTSLNALLLGYKLPIPRIAHEAFERGLKAEKRRLSAIVGRATNRNGK